MIERHIVQEDEEGHYFEFGNRKYDSIELEAQDYAIGETIAILNQRNPIPTIVCLCGSTRFSEAFQVANLEETLAGKIVLSIGCDTKSDLDLFDCHGEEERRVTMALEELHLRKIDLADEVLILNVGGYIGESTARELAYAREQGKVIRFLYSSDWPDNGLKITD